MATDSSIPTGKPQSAGVIAPPPLIYLAGLSAGLVLNAVLSPAALPLTLQLLGWPLAIGGSVLLVGFVRAFRRSGTAIGPYSETTALVTCGPYRLTRNPGYLGMALVSAGIALLADAPWALLPLAVAVLVIDRGVIAREERYLEACFGEEYRRYRARVRRWI